MIKSYLTIALRSLVKNKVISFIAIFGLAVSVGVSTLVYSFVAFELSADEFHANRNEVFLVTQLVDRDGKEQMWGDSPLAIGERLKADIHQIKNVVRIDNARLVFKYNTYVFYEQARFVDPSFMNVFSFPLKFGDRNTLLDKTRIIISEPLAVKYFGERNPVGEQVTLIFNGDQPETFIVGAVAAVFPRSTGFNFSILINWERRNDLLPTEISGDWKTKIAATFIQLNDKKDKVPVESGMTRYIATQNHADLDWPVRSFQLEPFSTLVLNSYLIQGDISRQSRPIGRIILVTIAGILLTLACFNYMNIAIVSSVRRFKEIGIRKTTGSSKFQLMRQFLVENVVICLFALLMGVALGKVVIIPWFNSTFGTGLNIGITLGPELWIFLFGVLLLIVLGSGMYPALYVSSLNPINIFRGNINLKSKSRLMRFSLTFQFFLSLLTMAFGVVFIQNVDFLKKQDWGYDQENIFVIELGDTKSFAALRNDLERNAHVLAIDGSAQLVGRESEEVTISKEENKYEVRTIGVGPRYLDILNIPLKQGRFFNEGSAADLHAVVVNETFVKRTGWVKIIDTDFEIKNERYTIIGIVKDFHYRNFAREIEPLVFRMIDESEFKWLSAKVTPGEEKTTSAIFESAWKTNQPNTPYSGFWQKSVFDNYFNDITGNTKLLGFTAILCVIVSCLGLYGLVSLQVKARMKDYGIRKILGANVIHMIHVVVKQYSALLIGTMIIAAPVSYYLSSAFLNASFTYHIPVEISTIGFCVILVCLIAIITTGSLIRNVIKSNPVDALRRD